MTTVRKKALSLLLGVLLLCSMFLASSSSGLAEADPETGEEMVLREGRPRRTTRMNRMIRTGLRRQSRRKRE